MLFNERSTAGLKVAKVFMGNVHTSNQNGSWVDKVKCGNLNILPTKDTFLC